MRPPPLLTRDVFESPTRAERALAAMTAPAGGAVPRAAAVAAVRRRNGAHVGAHLAVFLNPDAAAAAAMAAVAEREAAAEPRRAAAPPPPVPAAPPMSAEAAAAAAEAAAATRMALTRALILTGKRVQRARQAVAATEAELDEALAAAAEARGAQQTGGEAARQAERQPAPAGLGAPPPAAVTRRLPRRDPQAPPPLRRFGLALTAVVARVLLPSEPPADPDGVPAVHIIVPGPGKLGTSGSGGADVAAMKTRVGLAMGSDWSCWLTTIFHPLPAGLELLALCARVLPLAPGRGGGGGWRRGQVRQARRGHATSHWPPPLFPHRPHSCLAGPSAPHHRG